MAKSDKTDKSKAIDPEDKAELDKIEDAEIIEEQSDKESGVDKNSDTVALEEPGQDEEDSVKGAVAAEDEAEEPGPATEDAPAEREVQPEPVVAPENPVSPEKSGGGFLPLFLGGILAAGVGFGGASYLASQGIMFGGGSDEAIADLTRQLDDQEDLIRLLQSNQDKIANTANSANEGVAAAEDASARAAALSERVEELGGKLQALEGRIIEAEKRPMTEGASSVAIEAYEREVEQLRAMVAEQLTEAETLKETSARTAQETLAQAALTRVVSALDSGMPYRAALTELASVSGVSIPTDLSTQADEGVPTILALTDSYPEVARAALAEARKQEKEDGGGGFGLFLKTQLGARSTEPKDGDDADAILSRAEAALRAGQLADALGELDGLPQSAQELMSDWRSQVETRLAAMQAVDTLAQSLNSN